MPVRKGEDWAGPGPLPPDGVVVSTDAEARAVVTDCRRGNRPVPVLGLLGGDLCRTLGGTGDEARLRSPEAMSYAIDLGSVLLDGRLHWFVAHLVARRRWWSDAFVAMNAAWIGSWNVGPKAHPGDGLLDCYAARLGLGDRLKVRSRLTTGSHLPHPGIAQRRAPSADHTFERPVPVHLDGEHVANARSLVVRVEPEAITVVV